MSLIVVVIMWVLSVSSSISTVPPADALDKSDLIVESLRGLVISSLSMKHLIMVWFV